MNPYQRALRDFQDCVDDVSRARHRTFQDAILRLSLSLQPDSPLGCIARQLPQVDFNRWYAAQAATGGSMVGSARLTWPADPRERLATQLELVRRLGTGQVDIVDFTTHFMWVRNNFDDNTAEFVQQIFRPFARDFLRFLHDNPEFEAGLKGATMATKDEGPKELTLFISHSAADTEVAKAIVKLFEQAFKLPARRIRCTSVDGYRLPVGVVTDDVLRTEVFGAKLFIALLTPTSLRSPYVLFELGARWGARKPFFPVLAAGATPADLRAPLDGLNALQAWEPDQVRQLLEDASSALSERLEPMQTFSEQIEILVAVAGLIAGPVA